MRRPKNTPEKKPCSGVEKNGFGERPVLDMAIDDGGNRPDNCGLEVGSPVWIFASAADFDADQPTSTSVRETRMTRSSPIDAASFVIGTGRGPCMALGLETRYRHCFDDFERALAFTSAYSWAAILPRVTPRDAGLSSKP